MVEKKNHPDFKSLEASRPPFSPSPRTYTQTPLPSWSFSQGANHLSSPPSDPASSNSSTSNPSTHTVIDPATTKFPLGSIYKFLISAIVPRPIALISSATRDLSILNLAPYSYFNLLSHDPPLFAVGFTGSIAHPKDSLRNVLDSQEAVINIISEHYAEAANATCIDAPYGCAEWDVSGLTKDWSTEVVKAPRVAEAIVSVEVKVVGVSEYESRIVEGKKSAVVVIFEGVRFHVREDALDKEQGIVDPAILRPVSRLGGITYGITTQMFELLRPQFDKDLGGQEGFDNLKKPAN